MANALPSINQSTQSVTEKTLDVLSEKQHGLSLDWRRKSSPIFDVSLLEMDSNTGEFATNTWFVGGCLFSRAAYDGQAAQHKPRHIKQTGHLVMIHRVLAGRSIGHVGGYPFDLAPGCISIVDLSKEFESINAPSIIEAVLVPAELVGFDSSERPAIQEIANDAPASNTLTLEFNCIFSHLSLGHASILRQTLDGFLVAARQAMSPPCDGRDGRALARQQQQLEISRFIESNLSSQSLSTSLILKTFGVSRATLYRMFEIHGGVRNYIFRRRVLRAALDLADSPRQRGQIQIVAARWGFSSAANFNRSVRRVFGKAPGSLFRDPGSDVMVEDDNEYELSQLLTRMLRDSVAYAPRGSSDVVNF